ncbi:MAG: response regulator [Nitrososphaera sp.]|uniref:response regulator n=1 Tax=Nitrososphaera sp. TaxID=1971748 RepID=UPI003D6EAB3F
MDKNKTPHVIVCDNNPELNAYIRSAFMMDGYETHQALSATECIDKVKELNDVIDAIVVNGNIAADRSVMLIQNVMKMRLKVKIFVLADKNLSEEKTRIMDYGADAFALKPLSIETMINKVNSMLLESAMVSAKRE